MTAAQNSVIGTTMKTSSEQSVNQPAFAADGRGVASGNHPGRAPCGRLQRNDVVWAV